MRAMRHVHVIVGYGAWQCRMSHVTGGMCAAVLLRVVSCCMHTRMLIGVATCACAGHPHCRFNVSAACGTMAGWHRAHMQEQRVPKPCPTACSCCVIVMQVPLPIAYFTDCKPAYRHLVHTCSPLHKTSSLRTELSVEEQTILGAWVRERVGMGPWAWVRGLGAMGLGVWACVRMLLGAPARCLKAC